MLVTADLIDWLPGAHLSSWLPCPTIRGDLPALSHWSRLLARARSEADRHRVGPCLPLREATTPARVPLLGRPTGKLTTRRTLHSGANYIPDASQAQNLKLADYTLPIALHMEQG